MISNENIKFDKKVAYLLKQKGFWAIVIIIALTCMLPSLLITLFRPVEYVFYVDSETIGLQPVNTTVINITIMPIIRIIVTYEYTEESSGTCTTFVRNSKRF